MRKGHAHMRARAHRVSMLWYASTFLAMSLKVMSRACSQPKGSRRTLLTKSDRLSK